MLGLPPALFPALRAAHERREARERYSRWMDDGMRGDTAYGVKTEWKGKGKKPESDWNYDHSTQEAYLQELRQQAGFGSAAPPVPSPTEQLAADRAGWQALRQRRRHKK